MRIILGALWSLIGMALLIMTIRAMTSVGSLQTLIAYLPSLVVGMIACLGGIGLLLRRRWAVPTLITLSLVGVITAVATAVTSFLVDRDLHLSWTVPGITSLVIVLLYIANIVALRIVHKQG